MSEVVAADKGRLLRGLLASRGGFRDLRMLAVAQIAPLPIQIGLSLLTAAVLMPSERGSAVFVVGAGAIGASILFGSFHVGAVAALKAGDRAAFRRVSACVTGLAAAFALAAGWVAVERPAGIGLYTANNLVLILAGLSLSIILLNCSRTMQGLGQTASYRTVNLLYAVIHAGGAAVALLPLGIRDARAVTLPWLAALLVTVVVSLWLFAAAVRRAGCPVRDLQQLPTLQSVRSSLAAHGASLSQQIAYRSDLFLLGIFSTAALVGIYTLSTSLAEVVWIVPEIVALSVFADDEVRHGERWRANVARRLRSVLLVTAALAGLLVAGAALLLLVLLPAYSASFPLLLVLLPGMVLASGARVIMAALTARDERVLLMRAAVGTLALSVLYVPAIAMYDVFGAAALAPIVYIGQLILLRRLWKRAT